MLGLEIIDAHHHLCRLSSVSYPWLEGPPTLRYHGIDLGLRRDYLIQDYLKDAAGLSQLDARLVGSVHVENGAADPLAEGAWIDQVIADHTVPTVQVVKVDLTAPNARDQLAEHATHPSVRGVRDILNWHPNPIYTHRDRSDLMNDPAWLDGFQAVGELGLSFDLQVFPHQLRAAADLAAAHSNISIVLDHAGMPVDRDPSALTHWRRDLTRFAAATNTTVKISALGTNDHQWTINSIHQIVIDTIDTFGPNRCMFASNFPVDGLYSSYTELYRAFDHITSYLDHDERTALFAGTARRVYRM
ncbi:MAG: hypothetical protein JWN06_879 [Propionibacteriaceae bacterium]|jgi:predicted TIM-barrel fold metal-dependent hydrolase|nr:hypothetical protein [Propionibacteriaceae bacterium]